MQSKIFGYGRVSSKDQNEERQLNSFKDYELMKEIFILISKVAKILIEIIMLH